ncbi:hypothetical protein IAT38_004869 [Cryptococcus sp. DSM 104549]
MSFDAPVTPAMGGMEDDHLAPLKRNQACKQCKRRKTKCDGARPSCAPCMRSHAHGVRSAHRNGTSLPVLVCTFGDEDEQSPGSGDAGSSRAEVGRGTKRPASGQGERPVPVAPLARDSEVNELKSRIAELEGKLSSIGSSTGSHHSSSGPSPSVLRPQISSLHDIWPTPSHVSPDNYNQSSLGQSGPPPSRDGSRIEEIGTGFDGAHENGMPAGMGGAMAGDWGIDYLFIMPANWPRRLPSPFLLQHLVETFFDHVPQTSRLLHRPTLLAGIKLPPTSPNFPFPGLLHAVCAAAAPYTAWVHSIPPEDVEDAVQRHLADGHDPTTIADFGLAQAEAGMRAVDTVTSSFALGRGGSVLHITQTLCILTDVYLNKGMCLKGWLTATQPSQIILALEVLKRKNKKKYAETPILGPPASSLEREERLSTLWWTFLNDAGGALYSALAPVINLADVESPLPTSAKDWAKMDAMFENPQDATSYDLLYSHPVEDPFVLVIKIAILLSKIARFDRWIRDWHHRDPVPGDDFAGMSKQSFKDYLQNVETFVANVPPAYKNIYKLLDPSSPQKLDANILFIHILPSIAVAIMHEPFLQWTPTDPATLMTQKACEEIVGILHLIPSNLDVATIMTPLMLYTLNAVGLILCDFVKHALKSQSYGMAARHRTDLETIRNLLDRYGQRHTLGLAMSHFLGEYVAYTTFPTSTGPPNARRLLPNRQDAYPISSGGVYTVMAGTAPSPTPQQTPILTPGASASRSGGSSTGMTPADEAREVIVGCLGGGLGHAAMNQPVEGEWGESAVRASAMHAVGLDSAGPWAEIESRGQRGGVREEGVEQHLGQEQLLAGYGASAGGF